MADHRLATIYFSTAATGHNKESHATVEAHEELEADLDDGWRLTDMNAVGSGYSVSGDINAWLVLRLERADSATQLHRQRLVSIFLTSKGFGLRQKDDAGRYDTYPELTEFLSQGWEPVSMVDVGFPSSAGTSVSAGWLAILLEKV